MILRDDYLNKLIAYEEADLIRVITGVRRSGKSTILEMYKSYLSQNRRVKLSYTSILKIYHI